MNEWVTRGIALAFLGIVYAISPWLFVAVGVAMVAYYGFHKYQHGFFPGETKPTAPSPTDRQNLFVTLRSTLALVVVLVGGSIAAYYFVTLLDFVLY